MSSVYPRDQFRIAIGPIKLITTGAIVNAKVSVGDKEIARGKLKLDVKGVV